MDSIIIKSSFFIKYVVRFLLDRERVYIATLHSMSSLYGKCNDLHLLTSKVTRLIITSIIYSRVSHKGNEHGQLYFYGLILHFEKFKESMPISVLRFTTRQLNDFPVILPCYRCPGYLNK
jgi:hypothetical protein